MYALTFTYSTLSHVCTGNHWICLLNSSAKRVHPEDRPSKQILDHAAESFFCLRGGISPFWNLSAADACRRAAVAACPLETPPAAAAVARPLGDFSVRLYALADADAVPVPLGALDARSRFSRSGTRPRAVAWRDSCRCWFACDSSTPAPDAHIEPFAATTWGP